MSAATRVSDLLRWAPSTREIFLQQGRLYKARQGALACTYDTDLTVRGYAEQNGVAAAPLVRRLARVVEAEDVGTLRRPDDEVHWGPPEKPLGGTAATRELPGDLAVARVVEVQTARGPV